MKIQQTYALLALHVYAADPDNINKPLLPANWEQISNQPEGIDGFSYDVYKNMESNEVVISFRGTDGDWGDWMTNLGLSLSQETQAAQVYTRILKDYGKDSKGNDLNNIIFTGHSLGGGLAATMGVWFNRPSTVFDPAPSQNAATTP